jgi:transcriptional regulator with XRE-family HTH domain
MYLNEIERGRKVPIRGYVLERIANYFGISHKTLLRLAMEDRVDSASTGLFIETELKGVACAESSET